MTIDVQAFLSVVAQLAVVVGAITAGVVWLRRWIKSQVVEPVQRVETQVHGNDGHSMADTVTKIEDDVARVDRKIDTLTRRFEDHMILGHGGA